MGFPMLLEVRIGKLHLHLQHPLYHIIGIRLSHRNGHNRVLRNIERQKLLQSILQMLPHLGDNINFGENCAPPHPEWILYIRCYHVLDKDINGRGTIFDTLGSRFFDGAGLWVDDLIVDHRPVVFIVPMSPMFGFPYEMSIRSRVNVIDTGYLDSDFSLDSALHCILTKGSTEWEYIVGVLVKRLVDLQKVVKH
jgi:hypothetical protein